MRSIADGAVCIQTSTEAQAATPSWLGEAALVASHLQKQGILNKINERVRVARRRFGRYDMLDFLAVLFGSAVSGERTDGGSSTKPFIPLRSASLALVGRASLPAASTLSRFLAALPADPVEALRTLFLEALLARRLSPEEHATGLWDRQGNRWLIFDIDGTREAARQRALPAIPDRPAPQRRLRPLCAPGYTGRKRGEVVRTRTMILQAHTHQLLGTFGNAGNGQSREELRRAKAAIQASIQAHGCSAERTLLRLDGQYGTRAVVSDLSNFSDGTRGKDDTLLDRTDIQVRLHLPADQHLSSPESGVFRALYDCPDQRLGEDGPLGRLIVATHPTPAKKKKQRQVGLIRDGVVSELFLTTLPQSAFTASDVVSLSLHRGSFETSLEDEDQELEPDRWCSHSAWGQEAWQIVGKSDLEPAPGARTSAFARSRAHHRVCSCSSCAERPRTHTSSFRACLRVCSTCSCDVQGSAGRFTGTDFPLQPDGTLRCPADKVLVPHEQRREYDGSLRVVYSASIRDCRPCPLREQCQWNGSATAKPRQVSILLHPLSVGSAPLRLRETGTDGTSARRVFVSTANIWTSRRHQPLLLPQPSLLR